MFFRKQVTYFQDNRIQKKTLVRCWLTPLVLNKIGVIGIVRITDFRSFDPKTFVINSLRWSLDIHFRINWEVWIWSTPKLSSQDLRFQVSPSAMLLTTSWKGYPMEFLYCREDWDLNLAKLNLIKLLKMDTLLIDLCEETDGAQESTIGPVEDGRIWSVISTDREFLLKTLLKILDIIIFCSHRLEDLSLWLLWF